MVRTRRGCCTVQLKMVMIELKLDRNQTFNWLYYETGFEQLHPHIEMITWMQKQGWQYYTDWDCKGRSNNLGEDEYVLRFRDQEMMTMFLLRWSWYQNITGNITESQPWQKSSFGAAATFPVSLAITVWKLLCFTLNEHRPCFYWSGLDTAIKKQYNALWKKH